LLIILWTVVLGWIFWELPSDRSARPLDLADRTGIGVMLELVRTWSPAWAENIEIFFVATGGQANDFGGARAFSRSLQSELPRLPTLHICWFAPGIGRELAAFSRESRDLAESAARSLWLPLRLPTPWFRPVDLWPTDHSHRSFLALVSASYLSQSRSKDVINPPTLHHTAQLVTEIAIRWVKRTQKPPDS
jgi:hypothetical protein